MCKKLGFTALVVVAALFTLNKLDLLWHAKHAITKARADIRSSIPTEEKIARLKDELNKLKPEKRKHLGVIAEESVKVEKLEKDVAVTRANLEKWGEHIKSLTAALENDNAVFVTLGAEKLPRAKVEASLARKWESYKEAEEALKSQEELLARRKEKLEAAQSKLRGMESKEKELRAKVERLDLELAKLREAQMQNDIAIDDSQFSRVVKLFEEVENQIAKERKELELQKGVNVDTQIEEALNEKARVDRALKEVKERFGDSNVAAGNKK